ncbi:MAG: SpoIIE family protein phosphatase [Thermodesulfovibrionales bacterium]
MKPENESLSVLVADDDPLVREMIAIILEDEGYHVDTAESGAEALEKFNSGDSIGLIVSDMNMPGLDGLGLIRAVRDTGADVPIIILTGNSDVTNAIQALKIGASDYILKDENIQETIGIAVEKALETHVLKKKNQHLQEELARKNEKLEQEKVLVRKVRKNILPGDLRFPGFDVDLFHRPSDKIGGDFFDAWENNGRVHFLIGDVSGHGTSTALIMAVCKGILQSLGHTLSDPREIVRTANRMICDIVSDSSIFLRLLYGVFDRSMDELTVVSAGHNPVFLVKGSEVLSMNSTGAVIGRDPDDIWDADTSAFSAGTSLVLYSDGLTKVNNPAGKEFGVEGVETLLEDVLPTGALINKVVQGVETFCNGEFHDDLTLFILTRISADE